MATGNAYKTLAGKLKRGVLLGNLNVYRIILKWILSWVWDCGLD